MSLTFVRFLVVGGSGALVNSAALFVLYQLVGLPIVGASALSVELAIASNFVWNDRWTFRNTSLSMTRFVKFNVVCLGGLVITTATAWVLVQQAEINYLLANLIGIALAATFSFIANLAWTWHFSPSER